MIQIAKTKRQKYKPGALVEIGLKDGKIALGRLLPAITPTMIVYDFVINCNEKYLIEDVVKKPILFYCGLYRDIITKGIFKLVGMFDFTEKEIKELPFMFFRQDMVDIEDCIVYGIGDERSKAKPEECIGLERSSVWGEQDIVERIEDHIKGKKNFYVELDKVILSKDDPRYLAPPAALRWDFEKQEFYRTDK